MTDNTLQIKNSLAVMREVFTGLNDYRIIGSVLVAALNGKPHRELHDIDLLLDWRIYHQVVERFEALGFKHVRKRAPGFSWDEFHKPDHLMFGTLLVGAFGPEYFSYRASRWLVLRIQNEYLVSTDYSLLGVTIKGIPVRSVYEGIKVASLNSKRLIDKDIVLTAAGGNRPDGLSLNRAFRVRVLGVVIPGLYPLFSQLYNLLGGLRLRLGKSYDPWN